MLPEHLLQYLNEQILCREAQILQITSLLNPLYPSPSAIVVHGTTATGKTLTLKSALLALEISHTIVKVRECITARHLLEKTIIGVKTAIEAAREHAFKNIDGRCESLGGLAVTLSRMLQDTDFGNNKFVLIFDGIDRLRDTSGLPTLIPGLVRLGDTIPNLTVILVTTAPIARSLHKPSLPHIHFTPYDRASAIKILAGSPKTIFPPAQGDELTVKQQLKSEEDDLWLWNRYTGLVWDSFGKSSARDIISLRILSEKLWDPFVSHIRDGTYGTRDFSRLVVRTRDLFRDESVLLDGLSTSKNAGISKEVSEVKRRTIKASQDLSYYTKHLLLSAYLASYNPPRTDQSIFTRLHERKKTKAAARKSASTTKKDGTITATPLKHRKISRLLLGPQPFGLDRLLAIFRALLIDHVPAGNADILCQIATLSSLRMLIKASSTGNADTIGGLDSNAKWRVNVGWEYVLQLGKKVDIDMADYVVE